MRRNFTILNQIKRGRERNKAEDRKQNLDESSEEELTIHALQYLDREDFARDSMPFLQVLRQNVHEGVIWKTAQPVNTDPWPAV